MEPDWIAKGLLVGASTERHGRVGFLVLSGTRKPPAANARIRELHKKLGFVSSAKHAAILFLKKQLMELSRPVRSY